MIGWPQSDDWGEEETWWLQRLEPEKLSWPRLTIYASRKKRVRHRGCYLSRTERKF